MYATEIEETCSKTVFIRRKGGLKWLILLMPTISAIPNDKKEP